MTWTKKDTTVNWPHDVIMYWCESHLPCVTPILLLLLHDFAYVSWLVGVYEPGTLSQSPFKDFEPFTIQTNDISSFFFSVNQRMADHRFIYKKVQMLKSSTNILQCPGVVQTTKAKLHLFVLTALRSSRSAASHSSCLQEKYSRPSTWWDRCSTQFVPRYRSWVGQYLVSAKISKNE